MTPVLELRNVSKSFLDDKTGRSTSVIEDISLTINKGEALALIGPNGSGKSTLLRLIVGLDQPTSGTIVRRTGADPLSAELMFQDFRSTFLPWFSLSRNVTFPFRNSPTDGATALDTLRTLAPDLNLDAFPRTLSGGELQAAALARSVSRNVDLLLLDEPFGSLDLAVRSRALTVCREAIESRRADALVLVTQNLEDVADLAERVVVIQSHPGMIASEFEINAPCHDSRPESRSASMELLLGKVREVLK